MWDRGPFAHVSACPPHGIEFAFEFLLAVHKITRADPEQLQAPYQAEECLYTHLDEVEQTALDDGDTLGPHIPALIVDGSVPSPQTGRIQNLIHAFAQGAVVKRVPRKWHPLRRA